MKELTFTQNAEGSYEANATVNSDFSIRIERYKSGQLSIGKTSVSGRKPVFFYGNAMAGETYEQSFHDVVYPLYITVISESLPVAAGCFIVEAE